MQVFYGLNYMVSFQPFPAKFVKSFSRTRLCSLDFICFPVFSLENIRFEMEINVRIDRIVKSISHFILLPFCLI